MARRLFRFVSVMAFVIGLLTFSLPGAQAADITLGALIPLTGFATGFGENQKIGLKVAIQSEASPSGASLGFGVLPGSVSELPPHCACIGCGDILQ